MRNNWRRYTQERISVAFWITWPMARWRKSPKCVAKGSIPISIVQKREVSKSQGHPPTHHLLLLCTRSFLLSNIERHLQYLLAKGHPSSLSPGIGKSPLANQYWQGLQGLSILTSSCCEINIYSLGNIASGFHREIYVCMYVHMCPFYIFIF